MDMHIFLCVVKFVFLPLSDCSKGSMHKNLTPGLERVLSEQ